MLPLKQYEILNAKALAELEEKYRVKKDAIELNTLAKNTGFVELTENVYPDSDSDWEHPLTLIVAEVSTDLGRKNACNKAKGYLDSTCPVNTTYDEISISASVQGDVIRLVALIRPYGYKVNFAGFYDFIGKKIEENDTIEKTPITGELIIPAEVSEFKITENEQRIHDYKVTMQDKILQTATKERPFLNSLDEYEPAEIWDPADSVDMFYDLKAFDKQVKLKGSYAAFTNAFHKVMAYLNGTEQYQYFQSLTSESKTAHKDFLQKAHDFAARECVATGELEAEDLPALDKKINRACYQLYILQDLINDPDVTDIKCTAWNSIRCRVHGKAYITNLNFLDEPDYERFVQALLIRNNRKFSSPIQTFTDSSDEDYLMRFSMVAPYVTSEDTPYLHIRKIPRHKLSLDDLVEKGMLEPKVKDYLLDCCRHSRGIVIAGGPGSGKTVLLNALLEEGYEQSAEILVIQENDELFTFRKGVMFEHVVSEDVAEVKPVDLERLGSLALVAGANVFIIGEAKGAEICSAITLSNSGCRTAITIHSNSSTDVIDKMADLAMRGYAKDMAQAKRMLTSFQTVVFLKHFKVQEISEIIGFDHVNEDMKYRYIYRRE